MWIGVRATNVVDVRVLVNNFEEPTTEWKWNEEM